MATDKKKTLFEIFAPPGEPVPPAPPAIDLFLDELTKELDNLRYKLNKADQLEVLLVIKQAIINARKAIAHAG